MPKFELLLKTYENDLLILLFGLVNHEKIYWGRDCIDDRETQIGCEQKVYNGTDIEICVCRAVLVVSIHKQIIAPHKK